MLLALFVWGSVGVSGQTTTAPLSYYDPAIGKTGSTLKAALHSIIKGHRALPYTSSATDTRDAVKVLDEAPTDPFRVLLVYSGLTDLKANQETGTSGTWNREHLWPQSFGLVAFSDGSRAKTDLFNLRAIDEAVNSSRGNKLYDVSMAPVSRHVEALASSYDSDSWEPPDSEKGEIARALLYMATRYEGTDTDVPDLELSDSPNAAQYRFAKLSTLLLWNRQFPPSEAERLRNERIYSLYQHNRNPFIDRPEFAELAFGGAPSVLEAWKRVRFTQAELGNALISGDLADPDKDGMPNVLEWVFGRNPRTAGEGAPLSAARVVSGGLPHLDLR